MSVDPKTIALDKCLQRRPITFAKFCRSQLTGFDTLTAAFGTGLIGGGRRKTSSRVMLTGKWPATLDKRTPTPWLARSGPELVESQFAALRSSAHAWLTPLTLDPLQLHQFGFRRWLLVELQEQISARTFATSVLACLSAMVVAVEPVTQPPK